MKDWKKISEAAGLNIPDMERIAGPLSALEASFRPLLATVPHDAEPAVIFVLTPVEPEAKA